MPEKKTKQKKEENGKKTKIGIPGSETHGGLAAKKCGGSVARPARSPPSRTADRRTGPAHDEGSSAPSSSVFSADTTA